MKITFEQLKKLINEDTRNARAMYKPGRDKRLDREIRNMVKGDLKLGGKDYAIDNLMIDYDFSEEEALIAFRYAVGTLG